MRNAKTGGTEIEVETFPCAWNGCKTKHEETSEERFPNQNKGVTTKKKDGSNPIGEADYTGNWSHPMFYEHFYGLNMKNDQKTWYTKDGKKQYSTDINYLCQRHHVIPVVAVLDKMPNLKKNLKLLGWDVNNYELNGICLPMRWQDIFWHDLQQHRGGHSNYSKSVKGLVKNLESQCPKFCASEDQEDLWYNIEELVVELKEAIINWETDYLLYSTSLRNRDLSFSRAKVSKPHIGSYNRKFH